MQPGKLYKTNRTFLLFESEKDWLAASKHFKLRHVIFSSSEQAEIFASLLSKEAMYPSEASVKTTNEYILVLARRGDYLEVVTGERKGLIVYDDSMMSFFEEVSEKVSESRD